MAKGVTGTLKAVSGIPSALRSTVTSIPKTFETITKTITDANKVGGAAGIITTGKNALTTVGAKVAGSVSNATSTVRQEVATLKQAVKNGTEAYNVANKGKTTLYCGAPIQKVSDIIESSVKELKAIKEEQKAVKAVTEASDVAKRTTSTIESGQEVLALKDIHFMQSSIKNQTGNHTVLNNIEALKNGTLKPEDLPKIKVWEDESGKIWTLDHRRLASFKGAELDSVPVQWATPQEVADQMWKMTTQNGGTSIKLKLGNGQSDIIK